MKGPGALVVLVLAGTPFAALAGGTTWVVAPDGTGDFPSIQAASWKTRYR